MIVKPKREERLFFTRGEKTNAQNLPVGYCFPQSKSPSLQWSWEDFRGLPPRLPGPQCPYLWQSPISLPLSSCFSPATRTCSSLRTFKFPIPSPANVCLQQSPWLIYPETFRVSPHISPHQRKLSWPWNWGRIPTPLTHTPHSLALPCFAAPNLAARLSPALSDKAWLWTGVQVAIFEWKFTISWRGHLPKWYATKNVIPLSTWEWDMPPTPPPYTPSVFQSAPLYLLKAWLHKSNQWIII